MNKPRCLALLSLSLFALVACGAPPEGPTPEPNPEGVDARLRVLHLSPDAPNIDAFVNGEGPAVSSLAFLEGTNAIPLAAGFADLQVTASGQPASALVLALNDVQLDPGVAYTAIAFGSLDNLAGKVIVEDTQGLASNQVRVRVVHAAEGVGAVDVYAVAGASTDTIAENLFFGSTAAAVDIPAAAFIAGLDVDDDGDADLLFDIPALAPGSSVNVYAVADGESVFLLAQLPGDTTVRIDPVQQQLRVLHLSPDAPAVTPLIDGASPFGAIEFGEGSAYAPVGSSTASLDVTLDGTLDTSALTAELALVAGKRYTAVAFDNVANLSATFFADDAADIGEGNIRVRAIHGAPSVGQVDIYAVDAAGQALLLENVNFGDVAAPLDIPAGAYTLGVDVDNDAQADLLFPIPVLDAGTLANVYVTEKATGGVFVLAQLDGDTTVRIEPGRSTVRVLHLSRNAPAVDVFVDGARAITNLSFKSQSEAAVLLSGTASVAVTTVAAAIDNAVLEAELTLLPNESYTVVAYDDLADIKALVLLDDKDDLSPGNIRLPVSHVAPLVSRGDLFELVEGGAFGAQLVDDFGFGETQLPPDLPAAAYTVGFDANAVGVVAVRFELPLVTPGTFARAFVYNETDGEVAVLVQLPNTTLVVPGI